MQQALFSASLCSWGTFLHETEAFFSLGSIEIHSTTSTQALRNPLGHPNCCLSQEQSKMFHLYPNYGGFLMEDLAGKCACGGFTTLN